MGLLDSVLGAVAGAAMNNNNAQASGGSNPLIGMAMSMLTQGGGVSGLLEQFQKGGLGNIMQSWISTGANLPVSAQQIGNVLGNTQIGEMAKSFGVDPGQAAGLLAQFLPTIIDKLTPDGQVPAAGATPAATPDLMSMGMDLLKNFGK